MKAKTLRRYFNVRGYLDNGVTTARNRHGKAIKAVKLINNHYYFCL